MRPATGGAGARQHWKAQCAPPQHPRPLTHTQTRPPQGIVLLKNEAPASRSPGSGSKLLPLDKTEMKKVCVVGPLSDSPEHMVRAKQ